MVIRAVDLWKRYADWVLRGISAEFAGRALVWGENGSGKTTLVRIAASLTQPTRGRVETPKPLGVLLQTFTLHPDLTVEENLSFFARVEGGDYAEAVERLGLRRYLRYRFSQLSFGWKRRAELARALAKRPRALLLDEPLVGLDGEGRAALAEVVSGFRGPVLITASNPCEYKTLEPELVYRLEGGRLSETPWPC